MDIKSENGEACIVVSVSSVEFPDRPVRWLGKDRELLLVANAPDGEEITDADAAGLFRAVERCDADGGQDEQLGQLRRYGKLLFDAAFGQDIWRTILQHAVDEGAEYLEVAIRGSADDDHVALQALRWEALHDHSSFVTAQGTTLSGDAGKASVPVGVVRLIMPTPSGSRNTAGSQAAFQPIGHIPKVLFAVGSHLADPQVRPGAEIMGIMRRLDRNGGSVQARVLDRATLDSLLRELETFKPDVLHLIGHGKRDSRGQVAVQLRGESGGDQDVLVGELLGAFARADHRPTMVVLSACHTASAGAASALPFAARLVAGTSGAGGVPVVVAMANDISDTTCRLFTQAMTTAIGEGVPLWKAVIRGRRAAFHGGQGPNSGHWVMPALFLADGLPTKSLVNTTHADTARKRTQALGLAFQHPVFCGRATFITKFDRLLDGRDPLNVLVAYTPHPRESFGGRRLLQELGARAVRSDVLPVLLGPYKPAPQNLVELTRKFKDRLAEMRAHVPGFRQGEWASQAFAAAISGAGDFEIARAIRRDLDALVKDLPDDDPVRSREKGQPQTILLCHRVDKWGVLGDLINMLDTRGLKGEQPPVPVVLTGADVRQFKSARTHTWAGPPSWINCVPLDRFPTDNEEDILAYLWWLLNPPEDERVYALSRTAHPRWSGLLRQYLETAKAPVFPGDRLYEWARKADDMFFISGDDDKLLASYAQVLR